VRNRYLEMLSLFPALISACGSDDTSVTPSSAHLREASELGLQIASEQGAPLQLAGKTQAEVQQIGYGSYLANIGVCDVCHVSPAGEFYGGGTAFPVNLDGNVVYGMNLTPDAATGMALSQEQFIEVMRTGKDFHVPEGQAPQQLVVFPWYEYRWLTVADLAAMYAFFRALPPVANPVPPSDKGAYFASYTPVPFPDTYDQGDEPRALRGESGDVDGVSRGHDISPLTGRLDGAESEDGDWLVGRGSYLVNTLGHCSDCHTNPARDFNQNSSRYLRIETQFFLSGGFAFPVFAAEATGQIRSMSANLTGMDHGYLNQPQDSLERFLQTTEEGIKTDGVDAPRRLGWPMPWENFRRMSQRDLTAVYQYLKTIPPRMGDADKLTQTVARYCTADAACNAASGEACSIATNECAGAACGSMLDCGACQSCDGGRCLPPAANDPCFFGGL
jgi:hypothetical protein